MGNVCGNLTADEKKNKAASSSIDDELKKARKLTDTKVKLLLLGTGDSGKSTFAKQMTVLHSTGFTEDEYQRFQKVLRDNCLTSMQKILSSFQENRVRLEKGTSKNTEMILTATDLTPAVAAAVTTIWNSKKLRKVIDDKQNELQLPSSISYFFEHAKRFADSDYEATQDDILRARVPTIGVRETQFTVKSNQFVMVDVGGQRSERRKWLHCFQDVNAVLYLAALDEYDKTLEEDRRTNRMLESLNLYEQLSGLKWFTETPFILFLNKSDLFQTKIVDKPLHHYFADISEEDGSNYEAGMEYVRQKYEEAFNGSIMYPFTTNALDTENCSRVFESIKDNVLFQNLAQNF
eukprot:TRINITY_DN2427_c0_g1_i2.p1 TRINITY_DN2427_c0_g1~~TRINITY_DN2427_c0_g1_i2.p1  ORF type:complete len:386 (-),score=100.71 TRINITY_DN2427_c0_g1_i2:248-1294(-)